MRNPSTDRHRTRERCWDSRDEYEHEAFTYSRSLDTPAILPGAHFGCAHSSTSSRSRRDSIDSLVVSEAGWKAGAAIPFASSMASPKPSSALELRSTIVEKLLSLMNQRLINVCCRVWDNRQVAREVRDVARRHGNSPGMQSRIEIIDWSRRYSSPSCCGCYAYDVGAPAKRPRSVWVFWIIPVILKMILRR
ncbi:hypothetical protein Plhal304r1_c072g0160361 [Plasmopara halstedii]